MLLKCRPFYLPREFTAVYICAVYIPPDANAKLALAQVHDSINDSLVAHPDSVFIAAGDFNHADLKTVLHKFHRNVKCATRGKTKRWTKCTLTQQMHTRLRFIHTWVCRTISLCCYTHGIHLRSRVLGLSPNLGEYGQKTPSLCCRTVSITRIGMYSEGRARTLVNPWMNTPPLSYAT